MTLIVDDTFTEASDTALTSHTAETGGTWAAAASDTSGGFTPTIVGSVDEVRAGLTTSNQHFYIPATPANADLKATVTFRNRASAGNGLWAGAVLRMDHTAGAGAVNGYFLFYINAATPYFRLYKIVAGAGTQLGSDYVTTLPASETNIDFYAVGTALRVYSGTTLMITATDSAISSAGKVGLRFSDYAFADIDGVNISRIQAWDSATIPSPAATAKRRSFSALRGVYTR